MDLKNLIFEQAPISIATVNRPTALNALNREVLEDLTRSFVRCAMMLRSGY